MPSTKQYDLKLGNADFQYVLPAGISSPQTGSLAFTLNKQGDAPTIITNDYLLYGNVKATILTAPGVGMVSAFILMSDVLDEVDYEWLGAYNNQVQTNYFYRGITANYDRGGVTPVTTPQNVAHVYEIDWTETTLRWLIDGTVVRTLNKADTSAYGYPSTPSQIKIGIWASGDPTNPAGTIEWGGGLLDYSKAPYTMTLTALDVTSYTNAKSFSYTNNGANVVISQDVVASNSSSSATPSSTMVGGAIQDVKAGSVSSSASVVTVKSSTTMMVRASSSTQPASTTAARTTAAAAGAGTTAAASTGTRQAVSAAQVSGTTRASSSSRASGTALAVSANDSPMLATSFNLLAVAAFFGALM